MQTSHGGHEGHGEKLIIKAKRVLAPFAFELVLSQSLRVLRALRG